MAAGRASTELGSRLPRERILSVDIGRYEVDGLRPALVVRPETIEELAVLLRFASERTLAVLPWGAGTLMDFGNPPKRFDIALDLTGLDAITDYSPEDLVVTVQAGISLGILKERLAERGQFLALDTPLAERATAGGALSANLPGPNRLRYGTGRDLVIGLTAVLSGGEIVHSGGRVVKNVAGYDLNKLYLGALGTLGVIAEASFKLHPLPSAHAGLTAAFPDLTSAHTAALALVNSPLGLSTIELAGPGVAREALADTTSDGWLVAAFAAGLPSSVDRQRREVEALARQKGATTVTELTDPQREGLQIELRDFGRAADRRAALMLRCSVLPSEIPAALGRLSDSIDLTAAALCASPASGSLRLAWREPPPDIVGLIVATRGEIAALGGTVTVERCPAELKPAIDVWGLLGSDIRLMQDMKAAFDPSNTLSPGRYLGRL